MILSTFVLDLGSTLLSCKTSQWQRMKLIQKGLNNGQVTVQLAQPPHATQ